MDSATDSAVWLPRAIVTPEHVIEDAYLETEGGVIRRIGPAAELDSARRASARAGDYTLVPGFIDTHIHGGGGADTMDGTRAALDTIGRHLIRHGVTSWLPTTVTNPMDQTETALKTIGEAMREPTPGLPYILGAHLEGPYINAKMKGAQPEEHIRAADVRECLDLCGDIVRVITIAPEIPNGLELVAALKDRGIYVSLGHTDATYDVMLEAFRRGASSVTHGFNAQRGLHHREPGVIGAAMALCEMNVELIADLVHVHPGAILVLYHAKGDRRIILISDAMRAAGMPDGEYDLGGACVYVRGNSATLASGNLAGSITNLGDEVSNLVKTVGLPLASAIRMATENPARRLNVYPRKGSITPGADADLVALDADLDVVETVIAGQVVYARDAVAGA